jgi:hypothetical protein
MCPSCQEEEGLQLVARPQMAAVLLLLLLLLLAPRHPGQQLVECCCMVMRLILAVLLLLVPPALRCQQAGMPPVTDHPWCVTLVSYWVSCSTAGKCGGKGTLGIDSRMHCACVVLCVRESEGEREWGVCGTQEGQRLMMQLVISTPHTVQHITTTLHPTHSATASQQHYTPHAVQYSATQCSNISHTHSLMPPLPALSATQLHRKAVAAGSAAGGEGLVPSGDAEAGRVMREVLQMQVCMQGVRV